MSNGISSFVFHSDPVTTLATMAAGAAGVVIDWERGQKRHRQSLYNTQISLHDREELRWANEHVDGTVICRINGGEDLDAEEICSAIELGATEILIPMVTSVEQVQRVLDLVRERVLVGIMLETKRSLELSSVLAELPLARVYVGLNDLAIERKSHNIFLPLVDGTLKRVRPHFQCPFGVAGITHPTLGDPIPCHLLIKELLRLACDFSFLRRSYFRDLEKYSAAEIVKAIGEISQTDDFQQADHEELKRRVYAIKKPLI